jgi:hypothetical protein
MVGCPKLLSLGSIAKLLPMANMPQQNANHKAIERNFVSSYLLVVCWKGH